MSERAPGSAPKPKPPKESYDTILARMNAALARPAEPVAQLAEKPAFNLVDNRNDASKAWSNDMKSEEAQAKLDAELQVVESTQVEENPFVAEAAATETVVQDVPVTESAGDADDIAALELAFAAPDANPAAPEASTTSQRGELSHEEFHAQRPSEGIYRNKENNRLQHAGNGTKFASLKDYIKQTGVEDPASATKHYDEVTGLNEAEPATPERPAYETMNTDQLAFAYAKAEMLGDKFVTDDIRNVYTTAMEEEYTRPGSTVSYEEHEEAIARFDRLTEAAIAYEKAKDPEHHALVDAAVERANKEPSIGDKLKKLWRKGQETAKKLFRPEYWGERFTAAGNKIGEASTWALNLGVNHETDSDEEKDRKRNRNRVIFVAGGAAVAIATIAGAYGIGFAVGNGGHHATEALGGSGAGGGHGAAAGDTLSAHDQAVADALTPKHGGAEVLSSPPVTGGGASPEVIPAGFTISNGEGGEQLFNSLHIDPQNWYANQESFLRNFPNDFYRMPGGGVGIAHQGLLSPEARNAIEALK